MQFKEQISQIQNFLKELEDLLKKNVYKSLDDSIKEQCISNFQFIYENMTSILSNYEKTVDGNKMFIFTCFNNFEYSKRTLEALVKLLIPHWSSDLEEKRMKLIELFRSVRRVLVDLHNEGLSEEQSNEKFTHEDRSSNQITNLVNDYYIWGLETLALEKIEDLDVNSLKNKEQEAYYQLYGNLLLSTNKFEEALNMFKTGTMKFPDSFGNSWNYALLLEKQCMMDEAKPIFKLISEREEDIDILLKILRLYYLWNLYEEGMNIIEKILEIYHEVKIMDDHFLATRGYHSYSTVFAFLGVFAKASGKPELIEQEFNYAKANLADYDFDRFRPTIKGYLTNDWSDVINDLNTEREELQRWNSTTEVQDTAEAIVTARNQDSYESAKSLFDVIEPKLDPNHWLKDLVTLGRAEIANKFGKKDEEEEYLTKFFKNQPLMFEPPHVFSYGLDEYQEKLKKRYQSTKKDANSPILIQYYYVD